MRWAGGLVVGVAIWASLGGGRLRRFVGLRPGSRGPTLARLLNYIIYNITYIYDYEAKNKLKVN